MFFKLFVFSFGGGILLRKIPPLSQTFFFGGNFASQNFHLFVIIKKCYY